MTKTFFLESVNSPKAKKEALKKSYHTINEGVNNFEVALLESELSYKDVLIESMGLEARGILKEDAAAVKKSVRGYFEKIAKFFKDMADAISKFVSKVWTSLKNFVAKAKAWLKTKGADLKSKIKTARAQKVTARISGRYADGNLPALSKVIGLVKEGRTALADGKKDVKEVDAASALAVAIKNLQDGPKAVAEMKTKLSDALKKANDGYKTARKGLSASKPEEIEKNKMEVQRLKEEVSKAAKVAKNGTKETSLVLKDSFRVVTAVAGVKQAVKSTVAGRKARK